MFTCPISPVSRHNKYQNVLFICSSAWSLFSFCETLHEEIHARVGTWAKEQSQPWGCSCTLAPLGFGHSLIPCVWEDTNQCLAFTWCFSQPLVAHPSDSKWLNHTWIPLALIWTLDFYTMWLCPVYLALGLFCLKIMGWSKLFPCAMGLKLFLFFSSRGRDKSETRAWQFP